MNAIWKWKQVGDLLLICASEGALVDADFDPCLDLHRANKVVRAVTWSLGNMSMTAAQRKKAGEAMGDHPAANVTDSAITRGIITAFAWMGKPWKAFAPRDMRAAVTHVGVPAGVNVDDVLADLQALKSDVDKARLSRAS